MKTKSIPSPSQEEAALQAKNAAVSNAYLKIISAVKELIQLYPSDYFRTYIEVDYTSIAINSKHGFFSPLVHLRLEEYAGQYSIYFAKNHKFKDQLGYYLDTVLTRCVYDYTNRLATEVDIEDCLNECYFNVDNYRQAKSLLDQGFKHCQKVTVGLMAKAA